MHRFPVGRRTAALLPAMAVLAVLPASAQGATASADTFIVENDFQTIAITTVRYIAAPGEANAVVARYAAAGIVFTETGAPLQAGAGCAQTAPGEVTCSRDPRTNELDVTVDTRDGDDRIALQLGTPTQGANRRAIQVFAGDGADEITKDGSGGGAVWLDGGAGADRVVGGPGGGALIGGSGADTLIGGPDGQLLAGDGLRQVTAPPSTPNDTPVDTGPDGDDTIDGGAGVDTATWAGRATGVTVDLAAGTGGSPGRDADRVTGVENAIGTKQADTLRGDGGPNDLDGNDGGRDTIDGLGGNDKLSADRGVVRGGPGNDFLSPFDGEARCGSGVDYLNPFGAYSSSDRKKPRAIPADCERTALFNGNLRVPLRVKGSAVVLRVTAVDNALDAGSLTLLQGRRVLARLGRITPRRTTSQGRDYRMALTAAGRRAFAGGRRQSVRLRYEFARGSGSFTLATKAGR